MKIKMSMGISLHHLPHEFNDLQRIQHAQCIRQHIALYIGPTQCIHQLKDIFRRVFHAVTPVFQIDIHYHILLIGIIHYGQDILNMLFRSLFQLIGTMLQRTFAQ